MELHGKIVGYLAAYRHNNTAGLLEINDIKHTFKRKFVEVETVAHVIVSRYSLRIVIDHNGLIAELAGCLDSIDRAPVKLNRRTYTIST